jgi:predicted ferric reductase
MSKYLSNKGYELINAILWVIAIVGMIGLLCAVYELKGITKEVREYRSIVNRK